MRQILKVTLEGQAHADEGLKQLSEAKALLGEIDTKLSKALANKLESDKALRTVGHLIQHRLEDSKVVQLTDSGRMPILKTVGVLLLAGIVTVGTGAAYQGTVMAKAKTADPTADFVAGKVAMINKDYATACDRLGKAWAAGAEPEQVAGRLAECEFYAGRDADALNTCTQLEIAMKGLSKAAPYVRGLVYLRRGDKDTARQWFLAAEMAGHDLAAAMVRRCQ